MPPRPFKGGLRLIGMAALIVAFTAACARRPTQTPPAEPEPAPAELLLRDDFEGDSLAHFWLPGDYGSGRYAPGAVELSIEHGRYGRQSARITVREGDVAQVGDSGQANERAELDSGKHRLLGREVWCSYSFMLPEGFPIVLTRLVIGQWKQSKLAGSPIVAQRFRAGLHYVTIRDLATPGSWREVYLLPPIEPGSWNDMLYHIRFAADETGLVEIWLDGVQVVSYRGPTASTEGELEFYHKVGLYRDRMREPMTIYIDNYALGSSREAVDPATSAPGP